MSICQSANNIKKNIKYTNFSKCGVVHMISQQGKHLLKMAANSPGDQRLNVLTSMKANTHL